MPGSKYSNLSVRREVREVLDELRAELKISDLNDLLILLVSTYREHTNIISKLEEVVTNTVSKVVREILSAYTNTISKAGSAHTNSISKETGSHTSTVSKASNHHTNSVSMTHTNIASKSGKKKSAWEILVEQKLTCASSVKRGSPERVIESLRRQGAVIIRTDEDVCAVLPEFWFEFKKTLGEVKTPDEREVFGKLKDERMKKLFSMLRKHGALYLDNRSREWVYDYSFIEEPLEREENRVNEYVEEYLEALK